MAGITVRPSGPADRPQLVGFMTALNAFEHVLQPDRAQSAEAADAHLAYLEGLAATQDGFVLMAERDGKPAGFLLAVVAAEDGEYVVPEARAFGDITDIFVAADARGMGVGKALIAEAETRFRARGLRSVRVTALWANGPARAAYQALGYQPFYVTFSKSLKPEVRQT